MVSGPEFYITLKGGQVLVSGRVCFPQEGQHVVDPHQLGCLAHLSFGGLVGSLNDRLPNVSCEGLIGIGRGCEFAAYLCLLYFLVSVYLVIYVPGSFGQSLVGVFDLSHPLVGLVSGVTA